MQLDNRAEGPRLAEAARDARLPLKLFGGLAVWISCPIAQEPPLQRHYADIDVATLSQRTADVTRFLAAEGYEPDKLFNALHGATRMSFAGQSGAGTIDVIVDRFIECHTIDLRQALQSDSLTIPLPELLLTKLQVVEITEKDVRDILALLLDHPPHGANSTGIDSQRIAELASTDWGLEHTIRINLGRLVGEAQHLQLAGDRVQSIRLSVEQLLETLNRTPKKLAWRARALVGERLRWYQVPEESRR